MGKGCGSVGRAVAFDTRGPRFESSHFIEHLFTVNCIEKTKIKKKRQGMAHFKKQYFDCIRRKPVAISLAFNDYNFCI